VDEQYFKQLLATLGLQFNEGEVKYQVINIATAANALANSLTEQSVQPDRDYNLIVGIAYFETDDANLPDNYNVGFRTSRKQWIDDININAWDANSGVGPMFKYYRVNIPYGSGDVCYARILLNATAATSAVTGQMVLILKQDLTELPK
jgi:hypothetical protein